MAVEFLETIALILAVTGPGIAALIGYIRNKFNCIKQLREDFEEFKDQYGDRQLRHSKAFIIIANRLDNINFEQHGKELHLGEEIETILKDREGNL